MENDESENCLDLLVKNYKDLINNNLLYEIILVQKDHQSRKFNTTKILYWSLYYPAFIFLLGLIVAHFFFEWEINVLLMSFILLILLIIIAIPFCLILFQRRYYHQMLIKEMEINHRTFRSVLENYSSLIDSIFRKQEKHTIYKDNKVTQASENTMIATNVNDAPKAVTDQKVKKGNNNNQQGAKASN